MRLPAGPLIILIAICLAVDLRIFAVARARISRRAGFISLIINGLLWTAFIVAICLPRRGGTDDSLEAVMWIFFIFLSVLLGKIAFVLFDALAQIPRIFKHRPFKPLSIAAIVIGTLLTLTCWWGAFINRFNININRVDIEIANLPEAFNGYTIAQISDLHTGTFGSDTTFTAKLVDEINALHPNLIVFTGDIVNRRSDELPPHVKPLSRLQAPDGVFSILGNHDYGDYSDWRTPEDKLQNRNLLLNLQKEMGWQLLLDSHHIIYKGTDSLAIIGVENIGDHPFPHYGSLSKALPAHKGNAPWILLSHNPAHWQMEVIAKPENEMPIDLTLAGHTHAMQIEVAGKSPAALRYKRWGGLYTNLPTDTRKLYVNIGTGTVGIPMRIGATPEITLITLRHAK